MHAKTLLQTMRSRGPRLIAALALMLAAAFAVLVFGIPQTASATPAEQPKTTHDVAGRENCLMCHPVGGGVKPSPASHSAYTNAMCLGCHPAGAAAPAPAPAKPAATAAPAAPTAAPAKPEPTKASTPAQPQPEPTKAAAPEPTKPAAPAPASPAGASKTTHDVAGKENCTMCHAAGSGVKPSPANHSAYTNAMCLGCHPLAAAAPAPAAPAQSAPAAPAAPAAAPSCIDCHKNKSLSMDFPNGDKLSLFVDEAQMAGSVHGGKLNCTDCHSGITGYPHKKLTVNSKRDYSLAEYEACKRCHFANYTKTLDSMHYKQIEAGNKSAPTCTDCHGYHGVTKPAEPRAKISQSCGTCHKEISDQYAQSVHGAAITNGGSADVPTCTDCHGSHVIRDADTASFRNNTPELCANCHSDAKKMAKYNLSPNVYSTYMNDFHGVTVSLTKRQGPDNWTTKAVCTDCHGVHDIKSTKGGNTAEIRKNVQATCQKCHPDGGANFPDTWMSHYQLSLDKTPLPWLVRGFYWLVIPFMLGGLFLHMIVDLWRLARNR